MNFLKNKNFTKDNFFILLPNLLEIVHVKLNLNIIYDDILFIDAQKKELLRNTENFSKGLESHNCFLCARGMGKSSLIKCVINKVNNGENEKLNYRNSDSTLKYLPEIIYFLKILITNLYFLLMILVSINLTEILKFLKAYLMEVY